MHKSKSEMPQGTIPLKPKGPSLAEKMKKVIMKGM
jgi:hypothetical protein